jgi:hypothetical protein
MYYIDVLHSNMTFEEINLQKFKISSFPEIFLKIKTIIYSLIS